VHYCGVVPIRGLLQVALLREVRDAEPPIRLVGAFFEPGTADQVAAELGGLGDAVVAVGSPLSAPRGAGRACDALLERRGVPPEHPAAEARRLGEALRHLGTFAPVGTDVKGSVPEGAYRQAALLETNADGVFCALQGRRLPARRHPLGVRWRIEELLRQHVEDDGGGLWHRRIEEIDAAGAALCAHRYALGHASWLGMGEEGVLVLPSSRLPERFQTEGVIPPVERLELRRG
jgi:predicted nuclease with RNAse H fold